MVGGLSIAASRIGEFGCRIIVSAGECSLIAALLSGRRVGVFGHSSATLRGHPFSRVCAGWPGGACRWTQVLLSTRSVPPRASVGTGLVFTAVVSPCSGPDALESDDGLGRIIAARRIFESVSGE